MNTAYGIEELVYFRGLRIQFDKLGKVVKVKNFNVETLLGHGVLRSKCKLELKVDSFCKGGVKVENQTGA